MRLALISSLLLMTAYAYSQETGLGQAVNLAVMADSNWKCDKQIMSRDLEELTIYANDRNHVCKIPRCIQGKKCGDSCQMMNVLQKMSIRYGAPVEYLYAIYWSQMDDSKNLKDAEFLNQLKTSAQVVSRTFLNTNKKSASSELDRFNATVCEVYGEDASCLSEKSNKKMNPKIAEASERFQSREWVSLRVKRNCVVKEEKVARELDKEVKKEAVSEEKGSKSQSSDVKHSEKKKLEDYEAPSY